MNRRWTRLFRFHRQQPVSSIILTMGAVDMIIGGIEGRWSLMLVGVGAMVTMVSWRWWQYQLQVQPQSWPEPATPPIRYLPARSSRPLLPPLDDRPPEDPQRSR